MTDVDPTLVPMLNVMRAVAAEHTAGLSSIGTHGAHTCGSKSYYVKCQPLVVAEAVIQQITPGVSLPDPETHDLANEVARLRRAAWREKLIERKRDYHKAVARTDVRAWVTTPSRFNCVVCDRPNSDMVHVPLSEQELDLVENPR